MILLDGIVLGVVAGLLTGGSLTPLANQWLRGAGLFVALLAVQVLAPRLPLEMSENVLLRVFWTLPAVGCLVLAIINIREPGFALVATGFVLNIVVVTMNSGMPVLVANAEIVGAQIEAVHAAVAKSWLHVPARADSTWLWLADVIPVPGPSWHRGLISLGDILLSTGVGLYIFARMHDRTEIG